MNENRKHTMTLTELLPFIGCSELNAGLAELMKSAGGSISSLSMKKLRSQGVEGMEFHAQGLSLTFNEREDYIRTYAEPKDAGEAILVAVFAYVAGSKTFTPYTGPIPFSTGPVATREDALREFGTPARTEEEDDVIEWDQWLKDGFQMRARYRDDGAVKIVSITLPFK
jgi:hypothetical protein